MRAAIVVTGTEVLTGRVADANGPWLAERFRELGVDVASVTVVGDRPEDLRTVLERLVHDVGVVVTSGGLGPTADDLTTAVVAEVQGREMVLDEALEGRVGAIVERLSAARGWRLDPAATAAGVRKQAVVPKGAAVLEPVGTAPGVVVTPAQGDGAPVIVLPGPPRELQGMWPAALQDATVAALLADQPELRQRTLRFWGTPESEIAATLRGLEGTLDGLEITTCLRDGGELEVVTRYRPADQGTYDAFVAAVRDAHGDTLFSDDGTTVDELVVRALGERRWTLAVAEADTGGLLAARLSERAGASKYLLGGIVAYSNDSKETVLGVDPALIAEHGAVSRQVAVELAHGAMDRMYAQVGLAVTGVAGPGGGTDAKPVGRTELAVVTPDGVRTRQLTLPGGRADVRSRAVSAALHLLLDALTGSGALRG